MLVYIHLREFVAHVILALLRFHGHLFGTRAYARLRALARACARVGFLLLALKLQISCSWEASPGSPPVGDLPWEVSHGRPRMGGLPWEASPGRPPLGGPPWEASHGRPLGRGRDRRGRDKTQKGTKRDKTGQNGTRRDGTWRDGTGTKRDGARKDGTWQEAKGPKRGPVNVKAWTKASCSCLWGKTPNATSHFLAD